MPPRCRAAADLRFRRNPIIDRANPEMHRVRVPDVLHESCWKLAHSSSLDAMCASHPFFCPFGVRQVPSQFTNDR